MVKWEVIPHEAISWVQIAEENWLPLSVVIEEGTPNDATQPYANASLTVSADMSLMGMATGHRVNLSTAVRRCLKPLEAGKVTMSMFTCSKRRVGTANSPIAGTVCRPILAR